MSSGIEMTEVFPIALVANFSWSLCVDSLNQLQFLQRLLIMLHWWISKPNDITVFKLCSSCFSVLFSFQQSNKIDMNFQSDLLASFESNYRLNSTLWAWFCKELWWIRHCTYIFADLIQIAGLNSEETSSWTLPIKCTRACISRLVFCWLGPRVYLVEFVFRIFPRDVSVFETAFVCMYTNWYDLLYLISSSNCSAHLRCPKWSLWNCIIGVNN